MPDLAAQAQALKTRAETAQRTQLAAQAQHQVALDSLQAARAALVAEFPEVTSLESAKALLAQLEAAAAAELSSVQAALAQAGG